jgi:type I restriction enzyme M protein
MKANVLFFDRKQASENLPDPDVLARDIAENLGSALEQFSTIYQELEEE